MWNFQRIICIWICCVSCMFGTTQLSSLVQAVPYEYFDDHEQSFYDLDTEQIQAKYDTRLLSQQMLQTEQQQQLHLENLKGFHNPESGGRAKGTINNFETRKQSDASSSYISTTTTKLKSNDGVAEDEDVRNDWLEKPPTKAAASTSEITETLDELHLPRAASCFTNGEKYTHGQKVPRLDNCEVCLCMDGEIFCWWEKCDKKPTKASTTYDDYSTPIEESSTTRMQLNPKTTYKTTLKPMRKPKTNEDYKYDDDDSAEIREIQQEYEGLKEQLMQKEHEQEQHKLHHSKQMTKKKMYQQQQEEEKHNKKIKEQNKQKQEEQQQRHKQQQQYKINNEHFEQHHHAHSRNQNNHDYGSSGSSSKILNFPENLPSVLYYDYKTEEHHKHQHQHHEQHLKHQKQKQQQQLLLQEHEKELKQEQQQKQQHHVNRYHEYGQDFNTYSNTVDKTLATAAGGGRVKLTGSRDGDEVKLHNSIGGPSTTFKYFSNGNENIHNGDLQTDSDILPEPPTKKPKSPTSFTDTAATAKTTGIPISQFYRLSTSMMATTAGIKTKSTTTTRALTNTPPTASIPSKKQIFSPWDYNKPNRDKINNSGNNGIGSSNNNNNNNNNESSEDIIDTDDQDDAFHRWLTSTETNNKNNFTFNDAITGRDDGGLDAAGGSGLDASNNDYNFEDRIYENIDLETETGVSTPIAKTKATLKPLTTIGTATTKLNAFDMNGGGGEYGAAAEIYYDVDRETNKIFENLKYEQNFGDNNSNNNNNNINTSNSNNNNNKIDNSKEIINSNGKNSKNIQPFSSNPFQQSNRNNNNSMDGPTSSSTYNRGGTSTTTSNEDNGVASVVNIDIMLTASSADLQQQKQQPQQTNIETTNQHRQLQLQDFEHEKQIAKTQLKFIQPPVLISNTNAVYNNNPLYSIINDNTRNFSSSSSSNYKNITNIVGDGLNIEIEERTPKQNVGVNLPSINSNTNINKNTNNNSASSNSLSSSGDSFKFNHISLLVSQTNATPAAAATTAVTTPPLSTTLSPERQCNVMGTLYKIGDVLPQDTGNCLQCICIDGSTSDDTPRVTCSPHNCPPLVLPDLFDATGY